MKTKMEAKNLRLDNYVKRFNKMKSELEVLEIVEVGYDSGETYAQAQAESGNLYYDFDPIPINDGWLNAFGFTLFDKYITLFTGCGKAIIYSGGYIIYCGVTIEYPVRFVHELQNLFFAITGEELKVKDDSFLELLCR